MKIAPSSAATKASGWKSSAPSASEDGYAGIQQLAHDANLLFYMSDEAAEGRQAYLEKRRPDFRQFPHRA